MKILCVCAGGNVRSAQLAFLLKNCGHDAVPVGTLWNSAGLIDLLSDWAELITVAEAEMVSAIPTRNQEKVTEDFVVGPDRWGINLAPELVNTYANAMLRHGFSLDPRAGGLAIVEAS